MPGEYYGSTDGQDDKYNPLRRNEDESMTPDRPIIGQASEREITVLVCGVCGHQIVETLCEYECSQDGDTVDEREQSGAKVIRARFRRTETYLGDVEDD